MTSISATTLPAGTVARPAPWPGMVALFLGAVFLMGVGFSHIDAVHNAAHDARHAAGFPCH